MLRNYFKTAFRNLFKYKFYTCINVIGLAIGVSGMVWSFQNYRYGFSYDNFHPDIDHVYRGLTLRQGADGLQGLFPMAAVNQAKKEFSGITEVVRLNEAVVNIQSAKDETFTEAVSFTDPSFFQLFNFPMITGKNDLSHRSGVLITEKTAKKYFGTKDPIGKTLLFYAGDSMSFPLTVTGVFKDLPMNSTIKFDFLTNFDNMVLSDGKKVVTDDWKLLLNQAAYFKIPNPADVPRIERALKGYLPLQNKSRQDWKVSGFKLMSLRENASITNVIRSNGLFARPSDAAVYGPLITSLLILLCVCLNFSNITVSLANRRLKEIGVRKVMGSTHGQLIMQMLLECAIIGFAAIFVSVLINNWWLPTFNKMFQYVDVEANYLHDTSLIVFLGALLVFTVLLAGSYPAFYISRFNPSSIFRGNIKFGGSNLFSRIMLGLQISISLIAVIGGIAFAQNAAFQKTFDFGYDIHNSVGILVKDKNHFVAMKNEMSKLPQVTAVAGTKNNIGFSRRHEVTEVEGAKKETMFLEVGIDYPTVMNMKIVAGRGFSESMRGDYTQSILVTEKYASLFGWNAKQALGRQVRMDTAHYTIIGVLKDFHPVTLFEPAEPVVMRLATEQNYGSIIIQGKNADLTTIYSLAQATWKKTFPMEPFNGFYQDEIILNSYNTSSAIAQIFSGLAVVTVLLSAVGIFALISLTLLKRMREIALRKVVGAKPMDIYLLMNKGYFWIVLVAIAIGGYAGVSLTRSLLNQIFMINVGIKISTVLISSALMIGIALFTTGVKIWQAIRTKPVDLLRIE